VTRSARGWAALLGLMVVVAGCGGNGAASGTDAGASSQAAAVTSPQTAAIDPNFDLGQTVLITAAAPRPLWLVVRLGKPIEFRNVGTRPVTIVLDHQAVRSKPIAPGASFWYTPSLPISITYHVAGRASSHGAVQVTPVS
jgi:hypothetical protein